MAKSFPRLTSYQSKAAERTRFGGAADARPRRAPAHRSPTVRARYTRRTRRDQSCSTPAPILGLAIGRLPSLRLPALHPNRSGATAPQSPPCGPVELPPPWAHLFPADAAAARCDDAAAHTAPRAAMTPSEPSLHRRARTRLILPIWARTLRFFFAGHATIRAMHDKTPQRNSRRNPSGARLEHDRRSASAPSSERERSPRRPSAPRPSQERASKAASSSHRRTNVQRGLSELKLFNAFPSTGSGPIYVGSHAGSPN